MTLDDRQAIDGLPPVHEAWLPREHSLHRPRHGGRQLTALISALVFFAAPTLMWLGGMRPSELENHELASFPSLWDGWGFLTGMDPWATENLVFRAGAIQTADWISRTFFGEPAPFDQGPTSQSGPLPGSPDQEGTTTEPDPNNPNNVPDAAGYRRVIEGRDGWLYLGEDVIAKCRPERPLAETMARLAELREIVESSGRRFILVAVPDKSTMVPEHLPDSYAGKDCAEEVTPQLWQQLSATARAVDMRAPLQAVAEELGRPPYFPLDSHWTSEGALELVRQVAERVEPGVTRSWEVVEREQRTANADLPPLIGREGINEAMTYRLAPDGENFRTIRPLADLRKPVRRVSEPQEGMVSRPTLLLGDSFSLPVSAYIPTAFADVTQLYYSTIDPDPALVARTVAENEVFVLEIVERNIARGDLRLLDRPFLDLVRQETQNRPIR
ncbi:alginate O-acetyltransferase AlgX-related protein [Actinophytocola xanthii]|uniref:alginate O-acetyltransferase AlgX-related protein n=1 Tax=Actinophytocola xanthii TaxID=1912961 RepID=UPI0009FAB756|nr:hypothetical protein [Actinophytocola xanthii]